VVTNEGKMPTALEIAKRVKMVKPDTASIELAKGQELVKPNPATDAEARIELGWLKPGETKTASWLVKGAGEVTVTIGSTRGGVDSKKLVVP
jgi:hypothetical protein